MGHRFEDLVLTHLDAAYTLARYIARDPVAAEDIVQEAFLRAFRSFGGYRGGDAKSWLLAIVRNCSFDWSSSNKRSPVADQATTQYVELDEVADAPECGPEESAIRADEVATIRAMISRLPEPFRQTLVLRELEDLSYKQIAEITDVPVGTVMSRLARARRMLMEEREPAQVEIREPSR